MNGKKYLNNTISSACLQVITIISGLIIPIIILQAYGSTLNGLMNSVKQFINYLTLVEAGLATVSIAALYKPLAKNNVEEINGIVSATRIFYNKTGLIFSSLVVLTSFVFPYFVNAQVDRTYTILMVLVIGISGTLEYFIIGKYRVLLTADQKGYVITNVQSLGLIMNTVVTIVLVKVNYSLIVVQLLSGIIYLMRAIIIKIYVSKKYSYIEFKAKPNNLALSQRWDALIHQIAAMIVFNTDILLLTIFSTLNEVSVYAIYRMVFTAISSIIGVFTTGIGPALANIMNKSDEKFREIYDIFENMHYILLGIVYASASLLFIPFMKIYTYNINDVNYIRIEIMILFLIAEVLNQIRIPANTLVNINGLFKDTKNRAILEAVINFSISLILVKKFGIPGVLVGTICSYAYRTIDFILYSSKVILKRNKWISLKSIMVNIFLSMTSIIICNQVLVINPSGYTQWILAAVKICSITVLVFVFGNLTLNYKRMKNIFIFINCKLKKNR